MPEFLTPFRSHYEHSRNLDYEAQLRECADYVAHPEVLLTEFFESYYLVERKFDPDRGPAHDEADDFVVEPFYDELEIEIVSDTGERDRIVCAGGAFDPLPGGGHPALRRRGLDYVGMRGETRIVLGVSEAWEEATPYLLLLRVLNCFAEIAPPFQLNQLRGLVLRERIESDATFDLQIIRRPPASEEAALGELTRDLAEAFKERVLAEPQFRGTLGWIECLQPGGPATDAGATLLLDWRI